VNDDERPLCGDPMHRHGSSWHCVVKHRENSRRWYAANPDKASEKARRRREAHLEQEHERVRLWRARKAGAFQRPWREADVFALTGGLCAYCGEPATDVDHVIALSSSGPDAFGNLVPACRWCNQSKSDSDAAWIDEHAPTFWAWWFDLFMLPGARSVEHFLAA
jgi:5-methylcytosine-specific restriction endonuclease McrA